jgi:hypothetical protein
MGTIGFNINRLPEIVANSRLVQWLRELEALDWLRNLGRFLLGLLRLLWVLLKLPVEHWRYRRFNQQLVKLQAARQRRARH